MKRRRKTFKSIFMVLHAGIVIAISSVALAQGGEISGSVKDHSSNQGIQWVTITIKDVTTRKVAATGVTDASGNYSIAIPALGKYSLEASKPGY
ncbi:MAG: carboxypeptidase-like regulatory domain-containing protein, partial [Desulfobacterales bacterium]|nr:carboxypeptidase-like regulatory domain-containing protein [Desulfobacterales bacterium]